MILMVAFLVSWIFGNKNLYFWQSK